MATIPAASAAGREAANKPLTVLDSSAIGGPSLERIVASERVRPCREDGKGRPDGVVLGVSELV
jgi:hypothetical protein